MKATCKLCGAELKERKSLEERLDALEAQMVEFRDWTIRVLKRFEDRIEKA